MLATTLLFLATSFVATSALAIQGRAVNNIKTIVADITSLTNELTLLESDLTNLPKTGGNGLNKLDDHANMVVSLFQKVASDVSAHGTFSEADGQTVVTNNEPAAQVFISVFDLYVQQKPTFDNLAKTIPNLISNTEESLENMANGLAGYIGNFEALAPADVTNEDAGLRTSAMAAVASAIATYQS